MNRLILVLIVLLALSCKSSKKSLIQSDSTSTSVQQHLQVDSTKITSSKTESAKEEEEILEKVIQSYVALDSAGTTVFKPTTTTLKKSTSTKEIQKTQDTTAVILKIEESASVDSTRQKGSDLQTEFEGENITGSIVGALIPTWVKVISMIVGLFIATLVSRKIIKSINNNQIKQNNENNY